jgi:bis(5'-nucleosyl)-tetraphosphatase (symmetrical)
MSIYAIGDVQGCYRPLRDLLKKIRFKADRDQLWFVGDLVNRGPDNLKTLRYLKDLGDNAISILGNHDLHLLAVAYGHRDIHHRNDTFQDVVSASDFDPLIDWLRHRPIMHHDETSDFTMVHAGLPPQWNLTRAQQCANEIQQVLRGNQIDSFLAHMYGNKPNLWSDTLQGWDRLRFITNSFTRIRYCDEHGREDFKNNRAIGTQPEHLMPWFRLPNRKNRDLKLIFGHWATLGHHVEENIFALDSGCVWGNKLTAMRLDDEPEYFAVECKARRKPDSSS